MQLKILWCKEEKLKVEDHLGLEGTPAVPTAAAATTGVKTPVPVASTPCP
jgi:hypothetical protein